MYQSSDNKLILQQSNQAWAFYDKEGKFYDKVENWKISNDPNILPESIGKKARVPDKEEP